MVNDYSKLFNENMSSFEARNVFWNAAENLSKTEREKLFETVQQAKDVSFEIKGKQVKMSDLNLNGNYFHSKNPDLAEYVVKVD